MKLQTNEYLLSIIGILKIIIMLVEKYIIIGIYSSTVVTDIKKETNSYSNQLIDPITVIRESTNNIFVDTYRTSNTKSEALKRLEEIKHYISYIKYWSILSIIEDVSIEEARYLKLKNIKEQLK